MKSTARTSYKSKGPKIAGGIKGGKKDPAVSGGVKSSGKPTYSGAVK